MDCKGTHFLEIPYIAPSFSRFSSILQGFPYFLLIVSVKPYKYIYAQSFNAGNISSLPALSPEVSGRVCKPTSGAWTEGGSHPLSACPSSACTAWQLPERGDAKRGGRNVKREAGRGVSGAEREGWKTGESGTDGASGREPPGRATRAPPAQTAHASRTNHRKHPRKDRINPPGRAAQGAKPHTLTPFQRETPPKWTKSEKFSLLLRENRQQTETRYGIQFQGD